LGLSAERAVRRAAIDRAERTTLAAIDLVLASRLFDQAVDRVLSAPATERAVARAVNSTPGERITASVIDSRVFDEAIKRLLASPDLWLLVDEIARSPAVTEAISHQSVGFAEQVAGDVRTRSQKADDRLERAARRLLHRSQAEDPLAPPAPAPETP
jgi:hypothetical protein